MELGFLSLRFRVSWRVCLERESLGGACNSKEIKRLNSLKAFTQEMNHY